MDPEGSRPARNKKVLWAFALMIAWMGVMIWTTYPLQSNTIIEVELAKEVTVVEGIFAGWQQEQGVDLHSKFELGVYLDFIFIPLYVLFFFYGSRWAGRFSRNMVLKKAGYGFSFLALIAGIADILENFGLLHTLNNPPSELVVNTTYDFAVVKFSLLMLLFFFMLVCVLLWLLEKVWHPRETWDSIFVNKR